MASKRTLARLGRQIRRKACFKRGKERDGTYHPPSVPPIKGGKIFTPLGERVRLKIPPLDELGVVSPSTSFRINEVEPLQAGVRGF